MRRTRLEAAFRYEPPRTAREVVIAWFAQSAHSSVAYGVAKASYVHSHALPARSVLPNRPSPTGDFEPGGRNAVVANTA
jgi:hypothetical protein